MFKLLENLSEKKEENGLFYEVPFELTIHTPLHIGGGDGANHLLTAWGWLDNGSFYVLTEKGLDWIKLEDQEFYSHLINGNTLKSYCNFGDFKRDLQNNASYHFKIFAFDSFTGQDTNQLKDVIRQPDGTPYIPASSLKGALIGNLFKAYVHEKGLASWAESNIKKAFNELVGHTDNLGGLASCFKIADISLNTDDYQESILVPKREHLMRIEGDRNKISQNPHIVLYFYEDSLILHKITWNLKRLEYFLSEPQSSELKNWLGNLKPQELIKIIHQKIDSGGKIHNQFMSDKLKPKTDHELQKSNLTLGAMQGMNSLTPYSQAPVSQKKAALHAMLCMLRKNRVTKGKYTYTENRRTGQITCKGVDTPEQVKGIMPRTVSIDPDTKNMFGQCKIVFKEAP